MTTPTATADHESLDRRIVAALQVDGRASWKTIATVLQQPERTVARKGQALLESRTVRVSGLSLSGEGVVVRVACAPGMSRVAAHALSVRGDTTFVYITTGSSDVVAEFICPLPRLASLLMDELAAIPGVRESSAAPVARYFKPMDLWQPGILSAGEERALRGDLPSEVPQGEIPHPALTKDDRLMLRVLAEDGRATFEEIGRLVGVSEATARRRVGWMRQNLAVTIRAVVEPAVLGLPVETLMWLTVDPSNVEPLGRGLVGVPSVRYAAGLLGSHQMLIDSAHPTLSEAYRFMTDIGAASDGIRSIETALVTKAVKRGGLVMAAAPSLPEG